MSEISRERREAMGVPLSTVLYMCQAHDREQAAQMGEPSPWDWDDEPPKQTWVNEREAAMREALVVLFRSRNRPVDERDEAVALLSMARNTMGWIRSTVPMDHVIQHDPPPRVGLWIAMDRIDALLRRVGGEG